jgi:translation elongation factor EF-1beta
VHKSVLEWINSAPFDVADSDEPPPLEGEEEEDGAFASGVGATGAGLRAALRVSDTAARKYASRSLFGRLTSSAAVSRASPVSRHFRLTQEQMKRGPPQPPVRFHLRPVEADADLSELASLVHGMRMPGVTWRPHSTAITPVAFGVSQLEVEADIQAPTTAEDVAETIMARLPEHVSSVGR